MIKTNLTAHARFDRAARFEYIIDTIGFGEPITRLAEIDPRNNKPVVYELTTTGVVIVRDPKNVVITAYIAGYEQATRIWRNSNPIKNMPSFLYKKIKQNEKIKANQP